MRGRQVLLHDIRTWNVDSYYKGVAAPSSLTSWNTVEFDMVALTAIGSDWSSSTITAIRLILSMFPAMCGNRLVAVGSRSVGVASNNFAAVETPPIQAQANSPA